MLFSSTKLELENVFKGDLGDKVKGHGAWTLKDGVLSGKPTVGQKHAPVAHLKHPCSNGVIQYEVKLEDAKVSQIVLNDDKKDHKLRLVIFQEGKVLVLAGSNKKKNLKNSGKVKKVSALKSTDWYRVTLEYSGSQIAVHFNGELIFSKKVHDDFAADKSDIAFTMKGSASFRNFKYWSGQSK